MSNQNKNKTPSDISRNNSLGTESSALATVTLAEITPWARSLQRWRQSRLQKSLPVHGFAIPNENSSFKHRAALGFCI
jgi:hypothetical protein